MTWVTRVVKVLFWGVLIGLAISLVNRIEVVKGHFSVWAYGDAQMLNGGLHFAQEGFVRHHLLPLVNPGVPHSLIENNGPNGRYFHYPALHAIVAGVTAIAIGASSDSNVDPEKYRQTAQLVFAIASLLGFVVLFLTIKKWHHGLTAALAVIPMMLSGWTAEFADSICDQPLSLLFFAINAALLHYRQDILMARGRISTVNALIVLNVFLAARNSVETPIIIATFNLVVVLMLARTAGASKLKAAVDWVLLACVPAAIAIGLQFLQSYLEYGNLAQFAAHWSETSRTRFSVEEISKIDLIRDYLEAVEPWVKHLGIATFFAAIVLYVARKVGSMVGAYGSSPASETALAFAMAFLVAFVCLFVALPRQMMYMFLYSKYYLVFAVILSSALILNVSVRAAFDARTALTRGLASYLFAGIAFVQFGLIGMVIEKTIRHGLTAVRDEQTVFGNGQFWAFQAGSQDLLPKMNRAGLFDRIRMRTKPDDFVLYPKEAIGNSTYEVNPLFEFYTQRHGLPTATDIALSCQLIRSRAPGAGRVFKIVEVNEGGRINWRLDEVECLPASSPGRPA